MTAQTAVIVGGGATAARAAAGLRAGGFVGAVVIVAAEPVAPYDWLVLAEDLLSDVSSPRPLSVYDAGWYARHDVELRLGTRVESLDRPGKTLGLSDGSSLAYDLLLIATGTAPAPTGIPGADEGRSLGMVHDLGSVASVQSLREDLRRGGHVVVVGGSWAALDAVAAARRWGAATVMLVAETEPLQALLGVEGGEVLADLHRDNGVDVRSEVSLAEIRPGEVVTTAGQRIATDLVVLATSPVARCEFAITAGLADDGGVLVTKDFQTEDPSIWAAGSAALLPDPLGGGTLRWDNAIDCAEQGYAAGLAMAGRAQATGTTPHYRAEWYGAYVEFAGSLAGGYDEVVFRGEGGGEDDESLENFCAFWLRGGRVVAAMGVDSDEDDAADLVGVSAVVDTGRLADLSTPLAALR